MKPYLAAKTPGGKPQLQRQVSLIGEQIDQLVYQLYGLTEKETGVVESNS